MMRRRLALLGGHRRIRPADGSLSEPVMFLSALGVADVARGAGVGRSLLRGFEQRASELGMRTILLTVGVENQPARRLYEGAGWRPSGAEDAALIYYSKHL
jgi:GNAT superfamily N-acetyltransferase